MKCRYDCSGRWLKGNVHLHTTVSDGAQTPFEAAKAYADVGYDFVAVTDHDTPSLLADVEDAPLIMLDGVELTARQTIWIIRRIKEIMMAYKHRIRSELPKIYSQDLLNNLFRHPYTKIESVQADLSVSRLTAAKYLEQLTDKGFIEKHKIGRYNYYVNRPLMNIFMDIPDIPDNEEAGDAAARTH